MSRSRHQTRVRRLGAALIAGALLLPTAAAAQDVASPDRIDLPNGWQPEGITSAGDILYAGSLADGAIWRADSATGEGDILAPGVDGAQTVGIDVDAANGRLWAAGGQTGEVRVHDLETGEILRAWPVEAGFLNDVAVTPEAVYVTDSFIPQLIVIPLGADGSIEDAELMTVAIGGDLTYGQGFNLNGIVAGQAGLVVIHSPTGALYSLDPASGLTATIDTGSADLTAGDGLELDGTTLYVVRNQLGRIAVLELAADHTAASLVTELTDDDLDVPTTATLVGDDLWAVNARFGTPAGDDTAYWITRLDAGDPTD